jgi:phage I-like protein
MPIPKPNTGEAKDVFVARCMADPVMLAEYGDEAQRAAVCNRAWDDSQHAALSAVSNGLVRIPIAYTGDFKKGDQAFTISAGDLAAIQRNMTKRETVLDYEHLSASPDAPPGYSRAAGWLKPVAGEIEDFPGGRKILWGWAEFTPACLAAIRAKEFRYLSPEIHWASKDERGVELGTRLAAAAITNRPFLRDLPPIEIPADAYHDLLERVALTEFTTRLMDPSSVHVSGDIANSERTTPVMKNFTLRKMTEGEHVGKFGVYEGATLVGLCDMPGEDPAAVAAMRLAETQRAEAACLIEFAKVPALQFLEKAEEFANAGKLGTPGFLRAQKIAKLVDDAIAGGKILPKQREAMFSLAIADYAHTAAYLSELKPAIDLSVRGFQGGEGALTAREEMEARITTYLTDHKEARYADALRAVTTTDPEFYERYKEECATPAAPVRR